MLITTSVLLIRSNMCPLILNCASSTGNVTVLNPLNLTSLSTVFMSLHPLQLLTKQGFTWVVVRLVLTKARNFALSTIVSTIGKFWYITDVIQQGSYWHSNSLSPISLGTKSDNVSLLSAYIASHSRPWSLFAVFQDMHPTSLKTLSNKSAALLCFWSTVSLTLCYSPYVSGFFSPIDS